MITLFSRPAEAFADAVDGAGSGDPALVALLAAVDGLRALPDASPREEFRDELRARLLREAEATLVPRTAPEARRHAARTRHRTVAAAAALALVGGTAGVAAAAQSANPGDLLYPLKRAIERIETAFSPGQRQQGQALLGQAETRLAELAYLSGEPYGDEVTGAVADLSDEVRRGSDLLLLSFESTGDGSAVSAVREFAARTMDQLAALDASTGGALSDELVSVATTLQQIDARAAALCPTCSDLPAVRVPGALAPAVTGPGTRHSGGGSQDSNPTGTSPKPRRSSGPTPDAHPSGSSPAAPDSGPLDPVTSAVDDTVSDLLGTVNDLLTPGTLGLP